MKPLDPAHLNNVAELPRVKDFMSGIFGINHNIVNQSAMNVRAMANCISIMEQGIFEYLKFYQKRIDGMSDVFSNISSGDIDKSIKSYNVQAFEQFAQSAEEAAAAWKTACDCTSSLLSNIPEQMSAACHSFNLLTASVQTASEPPSSSLAGRRIYQSGVAE